MNARTTFVRPEGSRAIGGIILGAALSAPLWAAAIIVFWAVTHA